MGGDREVRPTSCETTPVTTCAPPRSLVQNSRSTVGFWPVGFNERPSLACFPRESVRLLLTRTDAICLQSAVIYDPSAGLKRLVDGGLIRRRASEVM